MSDPIEDRLAALRDDVPAPPSDLVDRVMGGIAHRPAPTSNDLRVRLSGLVRLARLPVALAAAAALVLIQVESRRASISTAPHTGGGEPAAQGPAAVLVEFTLPATPASVVYLAGDFNGWKVDRIPLTRAPDGSWRARVSIPKGTFQYAYVVDGRFVPDPGARSFRPDGFGGLNAVLRVGDAQDPG